MATRRAMKKQEKKIAGMANIKETTTKEIVPAEEMKEETAVVEETVKEAEETKAEAAEEVKAAKETAEKKEPAKRGRKSGTTKKEIKTRILIQHQGKEIDSKDLIAAVKKEWTKSKNKVGDMKSMDLYVKPEDGAAYYVINGDITGKVEF